MRLAYDSAGDGPPVVLLHGFPLDRTIWADQARGLADRYRVVTPDLRGHGGSAAPTGPYPMRDLAADVLETLDAAGVTGPAVVGGLSMGGYVALALAAIAPDRLAGLVLVNSRAGADPDSTRRVREDLAREVERSGSAAAVVEAMAPKLFGAATAEGQPELVREWTDRMGRTPVAGLAGSLRGMADRPDRTADLFRIVVPALVLAGEDDRLIPLEEARRMADALPRGRLEVIPGAGHLAPIENPEATTGALRRFLDSPG